MIADQALLRPLNFSNKFDHLYRQIPGGLAPIVAGFASFALSVICGVLGGIAGTYLYDRGTSKGDDFAVGMGGLFSVGTFTFVVAFTRLQKVHHPISSSTTLFAFCACLIFPLAATIFLVDDANYFLFVVGDWVAILLFGVLSLAVCRRWWKKSD